MLQVKSCNVNHNSESVFRYFASAVNSNYSTKCNRKDVYAICSYASFKKVGYVFFFFFFFFFLKSVMFLCTLFEIVV